MNKYQRLIIVAALINTLVMLLFPPFLSQPLARGALPGFDGFLPLLALFSGKPLFKELLTLQLMLVLINTLSAWLALSGIRPEHPTPHVSLARGTLWFALANLFLILAFPPYESHRTMLYGSTGGFEGFYFIFENNFRRSIFWPMLYIEITFLVINALGFFLLFSILRPGRLPSRASSAEAADSHSALGRKTERRHNHAPYSGVERRIAADRRHLSKPG
jgi:hypothetical protein